MRAWTVEVMKLSHRRYMIGYSYRCGRKSKRMSRLVRFADNGDNERTTSGGEVDGKSLKD
jgi:hypothetical protein